MRVQHVAKCLVFLLVPGAALGFAQITDYEKTEFSPARGETFVIPVTLARAATVAIDLYTADGDLVRTLSSGELLPAGAHNLAWDGRDESGTVVPDEVYLPVLRAQTANGESVTRDPRTYSGGELLDDIDVEMTANRDISYRLPAPSRVLIRAGIRGGPMLRSLANWEPHSAGRNIQRWDGRDESDVLDLRDEEGLRILVTGFRLPAHAIIATGNTDVSYREYRDENNWSPKVVDPAAMTLIRDETRIARQYYVSPAQANDPRVSLSFLDGNEKISDVVPDLETGARVAVKVEINEADRWLIDQSLYEVGFFVDHEFVSEEEHGYLPLTWLWTVQEMPPGEHVLTVNVSAFDGKVGVASKKFAIKE